MSSNLQTTLGATEPQDGNPWLKTFYNILNRLWQSLALIINGNISFGNGIDKANIDGIWKTAVSVAGNFTVVHNLGRQPVGYLMVKSDAFENLKFVSSTTTQLVLAGQNGGANILLFIF